MSDKGARRELQTVERRAAMPTQPSMRVQSPGQELDPRLVLMAEPDSERAASFRVLRHKLQTEHSDPKLITVASANPGEGKTTCAINLALALSEAGRARVALVEGNFRKPQLATLLNFQPPQCFLAQLEQHRSQPDAPWGVVEVYSPHLHVLALSPSTQPRPLVDGPAFGFAVNALKESGYDYIVVDGPSVLGHADVLVAQDSTDKLLLVVRAGHTSSRAIESAVEQLGTAKLAGLFLLDF